VSPNRIVLYGRSLGSGPSCYLAQKLSRNGTPVGGVILQVGVDFTYLVIYLEEVLWFHHLVLGARRLTMVYYANIQKCYQKTSPLPPLKQSPILSAYRVAVPFRFTLPGDLFPNIDRMADVESPVFVIHGTRDEIVPLCHGQVSNETKGHSLDGVFFLLLGGAAS